MAWLLRTLWHVQRVNMNSYTMIYNFGYHSTDERLKGNIKGALNLSKIFKNCKWFYTYIAVFKNRICVFWAASKQPLKLHLLKPHPKNRPIDLLRVGFWINRLQGSWFTKQFITKEHWEFGQFKWVISLPLQFG